VIAIDHRLHKLVQIQREIHKEHLLANAARTEIVKALAVDSGQVGGDEMNLTSLQHALRLTARYLPNGSQSVIT